MNHTYSQTDYDHGGRYLSAIKFIYIAKVLLMFAVAKIEDSFTMEFTFLWWFTNMGQK